MNTPIYDFVKAYRDLRPARFHMPGHKGRGPLGCEELDLTEIPGADSLYEAAGIIAESEANASRLFGCPTYYSTEGSSHCIRAMLKLAREACQGIKDQGSGIRNGKSGFRVLAARNVHRAFLSAAALLDLDVCWLPAAEGSYLSVDLTPEELDAALAETGASAVYLSCPDYLGFLPDLRPLAEVCHAHGALLLVDNAHGAYLRFLTPSRHPMDLGADLCCDSAHKTLPVLTGGAYLHVKATGNREQATGDGGREATGNRQQATGDGGREATGNRQQATGDGGTDCHDQSEDWSRNDKFGNASPSDICHLSPVTCHLPQKDGGREAAGRIRDEDVRDALALFGSTSPSYLILQSLDLANPYLEALPERLAAFLPKVEALKARLRAAGWRPVGDEPLKLTLALTAPVIACGNDAAAERRQEASGDASLRRETGTGDADCRDGCAYRSCNDRTGSQAPEAGGQWPPLRVQPSPGSHGGGLALAAALEQKGIFCEFADTDYIVFMLSPEHTEEELGRLEAALAAVGSDAFIAPAMAGGNDAAAERRQEASREASLRRETGTGDADCHDRCANRSRKDRTGSPVPEAGGQWPPLRVQPSPVSLREAMLSPAVTVPAAESPGRVLARPGVSCPPAVPILMPGERITERDAAAFERYGIETVSVLF